MKHLKKFQGYAANTWRMGKEEKSEFHAGRFDPALLRRVKKLAKKTRTSPRAVWEQLAERGLPALEQMHGIGPDEPQLEKPRAASTLKRGRAG